MTTLPDGFAYLEPFAAKWGDLHDARERYLLRQSSSMAELRAFHDAAADRLEEIFDYLDAFPPGDLPAPEARLFRTILGLSEVMQAVEVFRQPRVRNAPYPHVIDIGWTQDAGDVQPVDL